MQAAFERETEEVNQITEKVGKLKLLSESQDVLCILIRKPVVKINGHAIPIKPFNMLVC